MIYIASVFDARRPRQSAPSRTMETIQLAADWDEMISQGSWTANPLYKGYMSETAFPSARQGSLLGLHPYTEGAIILSNSGGTIMSSGGMAKTGLI